MRCRPGSRARCRLRSTLRIWRSTHERVIPSRADGEESPAQVRARSVGGGSFAVFAASNDSPSSALRAPSPRMRGEGQQISMLVHVTPRPDSGEGVARSAGGGAAITTTVCEPRVGPAKLEAVFFHTFLGKLTPVTTTGFL